MIRIDRDNLVGGHVALGGDGDTSGDKVGTDGGGVDDQVAGAMFGIFDVEA